MKKLLKEKFVFRPDKIGDKDNKLVSEKFKTKTYTVADLYVEAAKLVKAEMQAIKKEPLTAAEEIKSKELAKLISNMVLKEMKLA